MSDSTPSFAERPGDDAGTVIDEELVFDDFEIAPPAPAEAAAPAAAAASEAPRRAPRKGRRAAEDMPGEASPITPSAEAVEGAAAAEEPAGGTPAPFPPRETQPAGSNHSRLLLAIVACALFTSLVSLGGLIAVSRTLARAGVAQEEAVAERDALREVPGLVRHLDDASARLDAAAARLAAASPNGPPASASDVQHQLDALRLALANRQPEGVAALNDQTRAGFSEVVTRLDRLQARIGGGRMAKLSEDEGN